MKEPKKLSEMTREEINAIPKRVWQSWNPFEKKSCDTCIHLKPAISLWCGNKEAIAARGTSIPGIYGCKHWGPDKKQISKEFLTQENLEPYGHNAEAKPLANATTPQAANKEDNIQKNKNKWSRIKDYINKHK